MRTMKSLLETVEQCKANAFIFDMDGLIFDTERIFMEILQEIAGKQGYHLTKEMYVETLGLCGDILEQKMVSFFGKEYLFAENNRSVSEKMHEMAENEGLPVKPEIKECLKVLKEKQIPCAVASSTKSDTVKEFLEKAGLLSFFQVILGGEMVSHSKPAPDIFLEAARQLGETPTDTCVLEDSENGVIAASKAGCGIICIPDLKMPAQDVLMLADYVVIR